MCEVAYIQLPLILADIPLSITQLNEVSKVIASFEHVFSCGTHDYPNDPPTLDDHMLFDFIDQTNFAKLYLQPL